VRRLDIMGMGGNYWHHTSDKHNSNESGENSMRQSKELFIFGMALCSLFGAIVCSICACRLLQWRDDRKYLKNIHNVQEVRLCDLHQIEKI
jgi:hypothetical protein